MKQENIDKLKAARGIAEQVGTDMEQFLDERGVTVAEMDETVRRWREGDPPTICVDCKHCGSHDEDENGYCQTSPVQQRRSYVTGKMVLAPVGNKRIISTCSLKANSWDETKHYYQCREINTSGNCPKFERKEQ